MSSKIADAQNGSNFNCPIHGKTHSHCIYTSVIKNFKNKPGFCEGHVWVIIDVCNIKQYYNEQIDYYKNRNESNPSHYSYNILSHFTYSLPASWYFFTVLPGYTFRASSRHSIALVSSSFFNT